jgi:hypothetical protein
MSNILELSLQASDLHFARLHDRGSYRWLIARELGSIVSVMHSTVVLAGTQETALLGILRMEKVFGDKIPY